MNEVHVIPRDDLIEHEESARCVCEPDMQFVPPIAGGNGWVVTHHSLDGREKSEHA